MALEDIEGAGKFLGSLNPANPESTDDKREGDNHIRGVKNTLRNTFPNVNAAVVSTAAELDRAGQSDPATKVNLAGSSNIGQCGFGGLKSTEPSTPAIFTGTIRVRPFGSYTSVGYTTCDAAENVLCLFGGSTAGGAVGITSIAADLMLQTAGAGKLATLKNPSGSVQVEADGGATINTPAGAAVRVNALGQVSLGGLPVSTYPFSSYGGGALVSTGPAAATGLSFTRSDLVAKGVLALYPGDGDKMTLLGLHAVDVQSNSASTVRLKNTLATFEIDAGGSFQLKYGADRLAIFSRFGQILYRSDDPTQPGLKVEGAKTSAYMGASLDMAEVGPRHSKPLPFTNSLQLTAAHAGATVVAQAGCAIVSIPATGLDVGSQFTVLNDSGAAIAISGPGVTTKLAGDPGASTAGRTLANGAMARVWIEAAAVAWVSAMGAGLT